MGIPEELRNSKEKVEPKCDCRELPDVALSEVAGGNDEANDTSGGFYCNICGFYITSRKQFTAHMRTHMS